jgi:wyosine [tRNA(Phe)-imidazoG37] synthetase (radical SAM superfamily)
LLAPYFAAHGATGTEPYAQRPALMYEQRTTRRRAWTPAQRVAASRAEILVLRPTVNCNQDCTFCSANETSSNVWTSREEMLRAIARAGQRGIQRLSFSGGEPTLSKHLVEYVRCAARVGITKVELVSNGVLLDKPDKVTALAEAGLTHAFISLHAHDEDLSRHSTQKLGDFPRTVQAIHHLLAAGVETALNHVITARNYPYLQAYIEFVHREFGGRVNVSFAFVTPQFKALDNVEVMPRLSEVMPYLKRAMYRAWRSANRSPLARGRAFRSASSTSSAPGRTASRSPTPRWRRTRRKSSAARSATSAASPTTAPACGGRMQLATDSASCDRCPARSSPRRMPRRSTCSARSAVGRADVVRDIAGDDPRRRARARPAGRRDAAGDRRALCLAAHPAPAHRAAR